MGESATVEVLTAEVRVLMVGNRQVTLSVFNQLDRVAMWEEIKPMGRVNPKEGGLWVVGADHDGTLVRYSLPAPPDRECLVYNYWQDANGNTQRPNRRQCEHDTWPSWVELVDPEFDPPRLSSQEYPLHERCREEYQTMFNPWDDTRAAIAVLPLIVLAGLR